MTNFAKLYVPKCKNCSFCQPHIGTRRYYCQLKVQRGYKNPKETYVKLTDCACERYDDKRYWKD